MRNIVTKILFVSPKCYKSVGFLTITMRNTINCINFHSIVNGVGPTQKIFEFHYRNKNGIANESHSVLHTFTHTHSVNLLSTCISVSILFTKDPMS